MARESLINNKKSSLKRLAVSEKTDINQSRSGKKRIMTELSLIELMLKRDAERIAEGEIKQGDFTVL